MATHTVVAPRFDRYLYAAVAALFVLLVFAGFARTYYLSLLLNGPPLPSMMVHLHGIVMTAWVLLFVAQVTLISQRQVRVHQRLGYTGIGLAALIVVIGVRTALEAARHGIAVDAEWIFAADVFGGSAGRPCAVHVVLQRCRVLQKESRPA